MPQTFIERSREQVFLLPPDVREWLPADHLLWLALDAVAEMDLSEFYAAYRDDGMAGFDGRWAAAPDPRFRSGRRPPGGFSSSPAAHRSIAGDCHPEAVRQPDVGQFISRDRAIPEITRLGDRSSALRGAARLPHPELRVLSPSAGQAGASRAGCVGVPWVPKGSSSEV
jgi:hypothetical protein